MLWIFLKSLQKGVASDLADEKNLNYKVFGLEECDPGTCIYKKHLM